jgi:hypothetical protein
MLLRGEITIFAGRNVIGHLQHAIFGVNLAPAIGHNANVRPHAPRPVDQAGLRVGLRDDGFHFLPIAILAP